MRKRQGQMCLSQPHPTDEHNVGVGLDEVQAEKVLDLCAVDFLRPRPVELIQRFDHGQACRLDPSFHAATVARVDFDFCQLSQILNMCDVLTGRRLGKWFVVLGDGG